MGTERHATVPAASRAIIRGNPEPTPEPPTVSTQLIGRTRELGALAAALERLAGGQPAFVELAGEPGIGKTRLLGELAAQAQRRGWPVLSGRATEFEHDAPYGLWADAVEPHLRALDGRRVRGLAGDELAALAVALPAFAELLGRPAPPAERYVVHRALRGLLERLAAPRPLVLCLDDLHWADPASHDLVAALARRPPAGAVLVAVAYREGQAPGAVVAALAGAVRLAPAPLTRTEAAALSDDPELYELSGGNPFYLEQLARDGGGTAPGAAIRAAAPGAGIPAAVAAALAGELAALPADARGVLEAAAVAGEPFEPDLVAAVAELSEDLTLTALDGLLERALVRATLTPRRFAFRHPVVRHAVYAAAPAAWRLGAHARAAAALERRGAGPVERAHHVEHAARRGDRAAVDLLAEAAARVLGQAPASAARFLQSALRLLPDGADRGELLRTRAYALLDAGRLEEAHAAFAEALELLPRDAWEERGLLICSQTSLEAWSGLPLEEPLRRLRAALAEEPGGASLAGFALRMPLAGLELYELRLDRVPAIATEALAQARGVDVGHHRLEGGALVMVALGHAAAGRTDEASAAVEEAITLLAGLDDSEIGSYSQGFCDAGWALSLLGRYEEALAWLRRGAEIDHRAGHGYFMPVLLTTRLYPLIQLGRLAEAIAVGEEAAEAAWASSNPGLRAGPHGDLALARLLAGDADGALRDAREAVRLAADARLWRAKAGWTLGVVEAAGRPDAGIATILQAAGGPELPHVLPAERPFVWAALAEAELARGDVAAAERARRRATRRRRGPDARARRAHAGGRAARRRPPRRRGHSRGARRGRAIGAARSRPRPRRRGRRAGRGGRPRARRGGAQAGGRRVRAVRRRTPARPDGARAAPPGRPHLAPRSDRLA